MIRAINIALTQALIRRAAAASILGLVVLAMVPLAQAEPRRSLGHNTVGTGFPYHPGYFRFWFGDRDIGLLDRSFPLPGGSYYVNPDPVPPYPHERQFSRSRHVTGADLTGEAGGSPYHFDVDAWYGWPPVPPQRR